MTDRPILFSAPMVRALLDGRKTQTRRVLRVPPPFDPSNDISAEVATGFIEPQYRSGDRLWVREAWRAELTWQSMKPSKIPEGAALFFEADGNQRNNGLGAKFPGRLRPGMFMPRWASRLTLTVTDVRVQRLQEISEADALAEGCPAQTDDELGGMEARGWVHDLWDSLNAGRAPWASNPWVVALSFTVQRGNIDQVRAAA